MASAKVTPSHCDMTVQFPAIPRLTSLVTCCLPSSKQKVSFTLGLFNDVNLLYLLLQRDILPMRLLFHQDL
jgi:hypothetical protein